MSSSEIDVAENSSNDGWVKSILNICRDDTVHLELCKLFEEMPKAESFEDVNEFRDEVEVFRRVEEVRSRDWNSQDRFRLAALLGIFTDLTKQGWKFKINGISVDGQRPGSGKAAADKHSRQLQFHAQRNEQLRSSGTQSFVRQMEHPKFFGKSKVSVFSLMRDGRNLKAALESCISNNDQSYFGAIDPYVQVVDDRTKCPFTGFRLMDIWRYFRHTWSNPYQSIPGRTMMILVRDRSAEFHPVVGIAALSSASVKMLKRDERIGWEPTDVISEIEKNPSKKTASWFLDCVDEWIEEIYKTDLVEDGLLDVKNLRTPKDATIARLKEEEEKCRKDHHRLMNAKENKAEKAPKNRTNDYWEKQARTPLFRSKRCAELASLLLARTIFNERGNAPTRGLLGNLLTDKKGRSVIADIIKRAKARTVGTAIADLTVCGAIPPYNAILGGKLIAMLAVSPEVVSIYRKRYSNAESVIASSMAGRTVVRDASLVFVGTTSLYGVRPSQYDRISIPGHILKSRNNVPLRFEYYDSSEGWGTFQFSQYTSKVIGKFLRTTKNGARVNYVFGEGANPRLRALRDGLSALGLNDEALLRHGLKKGIYGIPLIHNLTDYLLGMVKRPKYIFPLSSGRKTTQAIVSWWMERWLDKRLKRNDSSQILDQVAEHTLIYPVTHGARVILPSQEPAQVDFLNES